MIRNMSSSMVGPTFDTEVEMALHDSRTLATEGRQGVAYQLSFWGQIWRLKYKTWAGVFLLIVLVILLTSWHWQLLFASLLFMVPTVGQLVVWWLKHPHYCPLDHVLTGYCFGLFIEGLLVMGLALLASSAVAALVSPLLFLFWIKKIDAVVRVGQVVSTTLRWVVFTFVEEILLVAFLRFAKQKRQARLGGDGSARAHRAYVLHATASAVGYASAQCLALTCLVTLVLRGETHSFETKVEARDQENEITNSEAAWLILLVCLFSALWLPIRLMASHLTILELSRRADSADDSSFFLPLPKAYRRYIIDTESLAEDFLVSTPNPLVPPLNETPSSRESASSRRQRMDETQSRSCLCWLRWTHFLGIIQWSWAIRALYLAQFTAWFYSLAIPLNPANIVSWVVANFVCWVTIASVAVYRVRTVESEIDPTPESILGSAANLRSLYGIVIFNDAPTDEDDIFSDDGHDHLQDGLLSNDLLPALPPPTAEKPSPSEGLEMRIAHQSLLI